MTNHENRATPMEDAAIIELYWQRDERAIKETETKYGRYLFAIAYRIVHDRLDCEECLNDTYLGAWNRIPPARPNAFQVFLAKITRNIAVDKFRMKHASTRVPGELVISLEELDECMSYPSTMERDYAISQLGHLLNSYLRSLSARSEFIFVCRYFYADRVTDIAAMLAVSPNTVYRELQAIRDGLKRCLEKEGFYL